ncbi:MAG: serine hydrolase [Chloroflexota bacterium]|nr:serine hydrolase [Chloroflexota bacterium]
MISNLLWQQLQARLESMTDDFKGVAGVHVEDLISGVSLSINGNELFPTASTIKIHILTQLMSKVEQGSLNLEERICVTSSMKTPGSGVIYYMQDDVELSLLNLAILMIIVSDNTATNLCIDLAGLEETNQLSRSLGLRATTLRRKMSDRRSIEENNENVATPEECSAMLKALYSGRPSKWVAEQTLTILEKPKNGMLNQALPGVRVVNKPGGMEFVRCDAGIVYLPRRPYVVSIMTKWSMLSSRATDGFIIEIARLIHETLATMDAANDYGLGIPR